MCIRDRPVRGPGAAGPQRGTQDATRKNKLRGRREAPGTAGPQREAQDAARNNCATAELRPARGPGDGGGRSEER
eukprot:5987017-Alexandrium_andersonii.AAC.1